MKIGILTFHWGTNYGGVLQAYALQESVRSMGHETLIVDYAPMTHRDNFFLCFKTKNPQMMYKLFKEYFKEIKFRSFRKKYLNTTKRYFSIKELCDNPPDMHVYISGSDQIWNPYVAKNYGEPYFLNFGRVGIKRISYAASLGCIEYPIEIANFIVPKLKRFDKISVRENTAVEIINNFGFNDVSLMPDPTLLIDLSMLNNLAGKNKSSKDFVFFYALQEKQNTISHTIKFMKNHFKVIDTSKRISSLSIIDWLGRIKYAKFVVTNSFHGAIFSILFKKKFIVVPLEGKMVGLNDRILTLLKQFNLEDRVFSEFNEDKLFSKLNKDLDWVSIHVKIDELKGLGESFLKENLM